MCVVTSSLRLCVPLITPFIASSSVSRLQSRAMGILGLSKLIADVAPSAIKENEMKNYFGELPSAVGVFFVCLFVLVVLLNFVFFVVDFRWFFCYFWWIMLGFF